MSAIIVTASASASVSAAATLRRSLASTFIRTTTAASSCVNINKKSLTCHPPKCHFLLSQIETSMRSRRHHNPCPRFLSFTSPNVEQDDDNDDHNDAVVLGHGNKERLEYMVNLFERRRRQQQQQQQHHQTNHDTSTSTILTNVQNKNDDNDAIDVNKSREQEQSLSSTSFVSPSELVYTGNAKIPVTSRLFIYRPGVDNVPLVWPIFRIMDENGTFRDGTNDGYHFEEETGSSHSGILDDDHLSIATADFEPPTSHYNIDPDEFVPLSELRSSLQQAYPNHAAEISKNGLLLPARHKFLDTNSKDTLARLHRQMVRLRQMDTILQNAQRQGRISFYMTCRGEEAIHFGAASALESQDTILAQYREQGLLMWRGFTLQQFTDQCFSNEADLGKGRQMPVHYGSKALNYQTISSPLGTQIPQASGAAYRLKLQGKDAVSICFFGEGCTSTTDFHSGLNFAATLGCPVIFFCRNNGYAISTSVKDQYAGDGVISRAPGYGIAGMRCDGADPFAVHAAVREARAYALKNKKPVFIEAMTYRQGHHSTSDDSLRYRSIEEVERFEKHSDPLLRLEEFLKRHYNMTDDDFRQVVDEEKIAVLDAIRQAEMKPKPSIDELFEDVYKEMPRSLKEQQNQLHAHIAKYPKHYR